MKIEQQAAWPCHECVVRGASFCSTLLDEAPASAPSSVSQLAQVFLNADKDEIIHGDGGEKLSAPFVLCKGWAYRFFRLPDGRRQILSVLIPGDLFSAAALLGPDCNFSVQAVTDIEICQLSRDDIQRGLASNPNIGNALGKLCSAEVNDIVRTTTSLRQVDATARVACFIQQLTKRLSARSMTVRAGVYQFPLNRTEIADATGLGPDQAGQAIEKLRQDRIIDITDGLLTVLDAAKLGAAAQINN